MQTGCKKSQRDKMYKKVNHVRAEGIECIYNIVHMRRNVFVFT